MAYRRYGGGGYNYGPGGGRPAGGGMGGFVDPLTETVKYLLIANVAVFFFSMFLGRFFYDWFSLKPSLVFPGGQIWRLVTYMFMHADFAHILFNMLILWWFGSPLEQIWGQRKFLIYYFLTGVGAGVVSVPFYEMTGQGMVPIVGASGSLFGILTAFALIYPNAIVYFMFLVPVKVKYLVIVFMALEFAATVSYIEGAATNVANIAHLSGAVIGYFYLRRFMDVKAYWLRLKNRKKKRPYRVVPNDDDERRGPWLH